MERKIIDEEILDLDIEEFEFEERDSTNFLKLEDVVNEGSNAHFGIRTQSLQTALDNFSNELNKSAIAKSSGLPVRTPSAQYKGFAAEEYFKQTLKIDALSKGISENRFAIITKGEMPDGNILSGIDMETDIAIFDKKWPWSNWERIEDYQSKIHNNAKDYAKDINNPQYKNVKFVGGEGQGVNDKVSAQIGRKTIHSDSITPEKATELADKMKLQESPEYHLAQEKINELNRLNVINAAKVGAITGLILSTTREVVNYIKNSDSMTEEDFIHAISNIICSTTEGALRGGALVGSVQIIGEMIGKEITSNSLGAVPILAATNASLDLAKDLYKCFVTQSMDTDDLLCNTVNNVYTSAAGFGGGYIGGQVASTFVSAKASLVTGATIGSSLGPIGTVVGSIIGGVVIGLGANLVVGSANNDAIDKFNDCISKINNNIEASGVEKMYYFADEMGSLEDFRLSFKNLLPCYNLISDLKEYNLKKKAMKALGERIDSSHLDYDELKDSKVKEMREQNRKRMKELEKCFNDQRELMLDNFKESMNNYIANSYMQYLNNYYVNSGNIIKMKELLISSTEEHNNIICLIKSRNEMNLELNQLIDELNSNRNVRKNLKPLLDKLLFFMNNDNLLVGREYISFEETVGMIEDIK